MLLKFGVWKNFACKWYGDGKINEKWKEAAFNEWAKLSYKGDKKVCRKKERERIKETVDRVYKEKRKEFL